MHELFNIYEIGCHFPNMLIKLHLSIFNIILLKTFKQGPTMQVWPYDGNAVDASFLFSNQRDTKLKSNGRKNIE